MGGQHSVLTEVLIVCSLLSFHVEQTVACPEPGHALGAGRLSIRLTVENQEEATEVSRADPFGPRIPNGPRRAWRNKGGGEKGRSFRGFSFTNISEHLCPAHQ